MDINKLYAKALRTLAADGPVEPGCGICYNLSYLLAEEGHYGESAYNFVSNFSNAYADFRHVGSGAWYGYSGTAIERTAADKFRREWCSTMADAIEFGSLDVSSY